MMSNRRLQSEFKIILGIFLIGIILFSGISSVYAETLTMQNIDTEFKKVFVDELNKLGSSITTTINTNDKTYVVSSNGENMATFKYGDDYIEFDNRNNKPTQDNIDENFGPFLCVGGLIQSMINLSGITNKTIEDDSVNFTDYDTYGLLLETEEYYFEGSSEDGSSWSMGGDYVTYFKMSFDTEKIKALINQYGTDLSTDDSDDSIIKSLVPTLKASNVTENSVTLYPHVPYTSSQVYCDIYRSNSADGNYEKISDMAINCIDVVGLIDDDLKSNTTYYYKATVAGGTKYSDVLKVTTKGAKSSNDPSNPKTGAFFNIIIALIIMLGSVCTIVYVRRKSVFKKI